MKFEKHGRRFFANHRQKKSRKKNKVIRIKRVESFNTLKSPTVGTPKQIGFVNIIPSISKYFKK